MTTTGSLPGEDGLVQVLDEHGSVRDGATVPDIDDGELVQIYEEMRFARELDRKATTLHRQGRIGTYPPLAGQEAAQIASTHALADDDWIAYQYREHGTVISRGISEAYLLYWMGNEVGNEVLADQYIFPLNISIGSQIPHATGMAWAAKLRGDDCAVVCHFGDGATSEGDFHEGLNFAGVFDVPSVFFCNNNQWAISVPRERQTAAATLAQKAVAYGFEGVQVDGMDPLAVYRVTREALRKARDPGEGELRPTLIEAVQYRFGAHTTADDPSVYRNEDEVEAWRQRDPIPRLERFLRETGRLDDGAVEDIEASVRDQVSTAIERAERTPRPDPEEMFADVYADRPSALRAQQTYLHRLRDRHGDDAFLKE